jgi:hypothetical protein
LAGKIAIAVSSETSVGSSNEVNSPVSTKPTNSKGNAINKLDEIMENWDLKESSGYSDMDFKGNSGNISNYPEEDFTAGYGDVSDKPEGTWRTGLELYIDEQTIFSSVSSRSTSNRHQVCVIINDTSEEFDTENNPIINPHNLERGANHRAEGEIESTIATREKVHLSAAKWQTIKATVNHGVFIPPDSTREVLIGSQYALHHQKKRLLQENVRYGEGVSQPAQQAGYGEKNATTRRTPMEDDTIGRNLMRIIWSKDAEKIVHKISTHHFCQSAKDEILCPRHPKQH